MGSFKRKLKWYCWLRFCFPKKLTTTFRKQFILPKNPLDDPMIPVVSVGFYYGAKPDGFYSKYRRWLVTVPYKKEDEKKSIKAIHKAYKRTVFRVRKEKHAKI